jgi:hypothetical protein
VPPPWWAVWGWQLPSRWRRGRRTLKWARQRDIAAAVTGTWAAVAAASPPAGPWVALGLSAAVWWLVWRLERRRQRWTRALRAGWLAVLAGPVYNSLTYQVDREAPRTRNPFPRPDQLFVTAEHDWHPVIDPEPPVRHWRDRDEYKAVRRHNRWRRRVIGLYVEPWHVRLQKPRNHQLDQRKLRALLEQETRRRWRLYYHESAGLLDIVVTTFADEEPPPDPDPVRPWIEATGVSEFGSPAVQDRRIFPHRITAGTTRYGKTTRLRMVTVHAIWCILHGRGQALVIIDPKRDQFWHFTPDALGMPGLAFVPDACRGVGVAQDIQREGAGANVTTMAAVVSAVVAEMFRRQTAQAVHLRDHGRYPDWSGRLVWLVIDEYADLVALAKRAGRQDVLDNLDKLLAQGAGFGILCDLATQSPRAEVLTGPVKANCAGRSMCGPGDPVELQVVFGKHMPDPPPYIPGMTVTRDPFPADRFYPYVVEKGYYSPPETLAARLYAEAVRLSAPVRGEITAREPVG